MKPIKISEGSIEALKWIGLILMTFDHANKYLFNETLPGVFEIGRLSLPIFVFVLAYNLARPDALKRGVYMRTMQRLAFFGALASVPFIGLGGLLSGWWPLNVMATLLVMTSTLYLLDKGGPSIAGAIAVFLVGGSSVEYWWPAIIFGLAVWWYCKHPSIVPLLLGLLACSALWYINSNFWALAALPLIVCASHFDIPCPRLHLAFYAYYPLHLAALWLIRIPMSNYGYLFF